MSPSGTVAMGAPVMAAVKRGRNRTPEERFWDAVDKDGPGGCWLWTYTKTPSGYGSFTIGPRSDRRVVLAHRFAYELLVGPVPDGLELDHVKAWGCTNRHCVNPAHLEAVTHAENVRRGRSAEATRLRRALQTHCKRGHPLSGENVYRASKGGRGCRACRLQLQRDKNARLGVAA